jgi:hypothetical protein
VSDISTVYVGTAPHPAEMARDLAAHRAVLVVTGGCVCRDAQAAETRPAKEPT